MNGKVRSAFGRVMLGLGRRTGVAPAVARLRSTLDAITARNDGGATALRELRDRARAALDETAALAGEQTVQAARQALDVAVANLDARLAAAPKLGAHRAAQAPVQHPPLAQAPAPSAPEAYILDPVEPNPLRGESAPDMYVLDPVDPDPLRGERAPDMYVLDPVDPNPLRGESAPDMYRLDPAPPSGQDNVDPYVTQPLQRGDEDEDIDFSDDEDDAPSSSAPPSADGPSRRAARHARQRESLHAAETPEQTGQRAAALATRIATALKDNGHLLPAAEKATFADALDSGTREADLTTRAANLDELARRVDKAISTQLTRISDLMVDLERLAPLTDQALKLLTGNPAQADARDALDRHWRQLRAELADPASNIDSAREHLDAFETEVRQTLAGIRLEDKCARLQQSLALDPARPIAVGRELGAGAFGRVVELGATREGTPLVGKVLKHADKTAEFKAEIEHEQQVYAAVGEHPNIARCYGIQQVGGGEALVLEKVQGPKLETVFGDLEKRYRQGEINRADYLGTLQQMLKGTLQGLAQFEALGFAHRDIKPDNIMLDEATLTPKLVDMGLGSAHGEVTGMMMALSVAPETLLPPREVGNTKVDDRRVDDKWDTFAVGKMLFPLLEQDRRAHDPAHANDDVPHYQFVPGSPGAHPASPAQGVYKPDDMTVRAMIGAAGNAVQRNPDGSLQALVGPNGEYVGQALQPASGALARPGEFAADTAYVDFMNRLTHPDPSQRMNATEALKHPFLTQQLGDTDSLARVLGRQAQGGAQAAPPVGAYIEVDNGQNAPRGGAAPSAAIRGEYLEDSNSVGSGSNALRDEVNYMGDDAPEQPPAEPDVYMS